MCWPEVFDDENIKKYKNDDPVVPLHRGDAGTDTITIRIHRKALAALFHMMPAWQARQQLAVACEVEIQSLLRDQYKNWDFTTHPLWANGYYDQDGKEFEFLRDKSTGKVIKIFRKRNRKPKEETTDKTL